MTIRSLSTAALEVYDLLVVLDVRFLLAVSFFHSTHSLGKLNGVVLMMIVHMVCLHHLVLVRILGSTNVLDLNIDVRVNEIRLREVYLLKKAFVSGGVTVLAVLMRVISIVLAILLPLETILMIL